MYSKAERKRSISLPARLFSDLSREDAERLQKHLAIPGVNVVARRGGGINKRVGIIFASLAVIVSVLWAAGTLPALALFIVLGVLGVTGAIIAAVQAKKKTQKPLLKLREGAAALPASDPLVGRLATLSQGKIAADVRERLGHLALTVQQLVDHRAGLPEVERKEVDVVTEPIASLVDLIEAEVARVTELDRAMAELDEGTLVRALSSANATGGDTTTLLDGLHRLRDLEQSRAAAMHRLLEATTLLRRAAELGLRVKDDAAQQDREVQLALAALGG
jgi:hypothetical protein